MNARIGSVPYLNGKPLVEGLAHVEYHPPARLAEMLRNGSLDAALVPLAEVLEHPGYNLVDGVAIASPRMVKSVIIAYARPLYEIKTISMDNQSKTSVLLGQLIMERDYGRQITWAQDGDMSDAQLLIGDRALEFRKKYPNVRVLDLARAWHDRRRLPFVFAVWAISPDFSEPEAIALAIRNAKKQGMKKIATYAKDEDEIKYLTENISYNLGKPEKESIALFQRELIDLKLLEGFLELEWI